MRGLERELTNSFESSLSNTANHWREISLIEDDRQRCRSFSDVYYHIHCLFHETCKLVSQRSDEAYQILADLIANRICLNQDLSRSLKSIILTVLARWSYDSSYTRGKSISGRNVAKFARVINQSSNQCAKCYVQWFEDMDNGIPVINGEVGEWVLQPQPTRVMRGILFDTRLQNEGMNQFWSLAAESSYFPVRLFLDPGDNDHCSCYLTTSQMRQLSGFLALAPIEAATKFGIFFRDHVLTMNNIVYASIVLPGGAVIQASVCDMGEEDLVELFGWLGFDLTKLHGPTDVRRKIIPVTDADRQKILTAVLNEIKVNDRRELFTTLFFAS